MSTAVNLSAFRTEADPTHFDRIPDPREMVKNGGIPGIEYCFVPGHRIGMYQKSSKNDPRGQWALTRNVPVISIKGPAGLADSVVVMSRGKPIPGASTENGSRTWGWDNELAKITGLTWKGAKDAARKPGQEAGAKGKGQGREGDARVQSGEPALGVQEGAQGHQP